MIQTQGALVGADFVIQAQGVRSMDRPYWTGNNWCTFLRYAKHYTPTDAAAIVRKRFLKLEKTPKVRSYEAELAKEIRRPWVSQ